MENNKAFDIYQQIKKDILERYYNPGERLNEKELCEKYQSSRTPVREALNSLRSELIVDYIPAYGHFVSKFDGNRIEKIYEVIEALESMEVKLIALNNKKEKRDFPELEKAIADMQKAVDEENWDEWIIADKNFHEVLRSYCENEYLVSELETYSGPVERNRYLVTKSFSDKKRSTEDHAKVVNAILNGDDEEATLATHNHYKWMVKESIKIIDQFKLF